MKFTAPAVLVAGLLAAAVLAWAVAVSARRRSAALAAAGAVASGARQAGAWLTVGGLAVLAVAASGPVASVSVPRATGTVIMAMDVSGSMAARDVAPDRLAVAQQAALGFARAQPSSLKIGVVAFEEGALTTATPSADHSVAETAVRRLRVSGGTSLGSAIVGALSAITGKTVAVGKTGAIPDIGYWPSATIVIFSDGQDEDEGVPTATAAQVAQKAGVHVDTVGVGTPAGTTVDAGGYHLHTALDAAALRKIATTTGGTYHRAGAGTADVASQVDLRLTIAARQVPLAGALIVAALVLLAAGAALTVKRTGRVV